MNFTTDVSSRYYVASANDRTYTERFTCDGNTLDFAYDAEGKPYSLTYNGTKYYYITDVQGDVMDLVNSSGTEVASYVYSVRRGLFYYAIIKRSWEVIMDGITKWFQ